MPSTAVVEAALRAARRVNDYSTAVRIFEGIKEKVENKQQYQAYLDELKPVREELGVYNFSRCITQYPHSYVYRNLYSGGVVQLVKGATIVTVEFMCAYHAFTVPLHPHALVHRVRRKEEFSFSPSQSEIEVVLQPLTPVLCLCELHSEFVATMTLCQPSQRLVVHILVPLVSSLSNSCGRNTVPFSFCTYLNKAFLVSSSVARRRLPPNCIVLQLGSRIESRSNPHSHICQFHTKYVVPTVHNRRYIGARQYLASAATAWTISTTTVSLLSKRPL